MSAHVLLNLLKLAEEKGLNARLACQEFISFSQ